MKLGIGTERQRNGVAASPYEGALKALRGTLVWVAGFSALINILMLTGSIYMLQVYDRVLTSGSVPTLLGLFAVVVVLYMFLAFYDALRARLLSRSALQLDAAVAEPAFRATLTMAESDSRHPLRDLETVRGFMASPALQGLFDLPFVPLFLGVLFLIHPILGFATVGGALIGLFIALATRAVTGVPLSRAQEVEGQARHFADHTA
ncbi:MAG: type I secretion system permease/ATPase, partial [Paracoccaceae bacterium]